MNLSSEVCCICFFSAKMITVTVRTPNDKTHPFHVCEETTVWELKTLLQKLIPVPAAHQQLMRSHWGIWPLQNASSLRASGIVDGELIVLTTFPVFFGRMEERKILVATVCESTLDDLKVAFLTTFLNERNLTVNKILFKVQGHLMQGVVSNYTILFNEGITVYTLQNEDWILEPHFMGNACVAG